MLQFKSNELQIINVFPLTVVPPLDYQKSRREKQDRDPLIDGRKIGSCNGWMYEQRERANVKYVGSLHECSFLFSPPRDESKKLGYAYEVHSRDSNFYKHNKRLMVVCGARKEEKIGPLGPHAVPNFKPAAKGLE
ncbi:hypothetical protein WN943_003101 [Citrus x changshan-huyou]